MFESSRGRHFSPDSPCRVNIRVNVGAFAWDAVGPCKVPERCARELCCDLIDAV